MKKNKTYIFTTGTKYSKMILQELEGENNIEIFYDSGKEKNSLVNWLRVKSTSKEMSKFFPNFIKKYAYRSFFKNLNINNNTKGNIIFFDNYDYSKREMFISWLKSEYPNLNLILWFWNSLKEKNKIEKYKALYHKVCTFDKQDSEKYEIQYLPQFYSEKLASNYRKDFQEKKVIFIGYDKGRMEFINNIGKQLETIKINCFFQICRDKKTIYDEKKISEMWINKFIVEKTIDYDKVLEITSKGDTLLDIVAGNQAGLTLRVMESLFLKKKLITNNKSLKEYDFYSPNNILIIEKAEDIKSEFFDCKYIETKKEILDNYSVGKWIEKITQRGE